MIYFITDGQYVKIGFTGKDDVTERLTALQIGNPKELKVIGVIEGDRETERILHTVFAPLKAQGEWFKIDKDTQSELVEKHKIVSGTRGLVYKAYKQKPEITQQEIADSIGISRQMVSKYKKELNGYLK